MDSPSAASAQTPANAHPNAARSGPSAARKRSSLVRVRVFTHPPDVHPDDAERVAR